MNRYKYEELSTAPLIVGAIYESAESSSIEYEPISNLFKGLGIGNMGGYRPKTKTIPPFAILYSTGKEEEWPDRFFPETGIMEYYGDNRSPDKDLLDTPLNTVLKQCFELLSGSFEDRKRIPPFLIFRKIDKKFRNVQFLGLGALGRKDLEPGKCLRVITGEKKSQIFTNYLTYLTILNIREISWDWLKALKNGEHNAFELAPKQWLNYVNHGQKGIEPLRPELNIDSRNDYLRYFSEFIAPDSLKDGIKELMDDQDGWFVFEDSDLEKLAQEKTEKTVKLYKRNLALIKKLKELYKGKCQICNFTFTKKDGENYSECHHLISLGDVGSDTVSNIVVLCANCHRILHYSNVEFKTIQENYYSVNINDVSKSIIYKPEHFEYL